MFELRDRGRERPRLPVGRWRVEQRSKVAVQAVTELLRDEAAAVAEDSCHFDGDERLVAVDDEMERGVGERQMRPVLSDRMQDVVRRSLDEDDMRPPRGVFVVATLRGDAIGCGALKVHANEPTELKRMWVAPAARRLGVGRRLLAELERRAVERGINMIRLETNKALTEAIAMYRAAGYREVRAFNDERYADYWFEKRV